MRKKILAIVFAAALLVATTVPMVGGGTAFAGHKGGPDGVGDPPCSQQHGKAAAIGHANPNAASAGHSAHDCA